MATGNDENPNEIPLNEEARQVMSPSGAQTSRDDRGPRGPAPNGILIPPPRGTQDMDGETVAATEQESGPRDLGVMTTPPMPVEATLGSTETELPSSSRATISSSSARGFLLGPRAGAKGGPAEGTETSGRVQGSFLGGVAKAVQAIPAAVEGLVLGHPTPVPSMPEVPSGSTGGFVSAQSGSPEGVTRPPPEAPYPTTPLLDEHTLQRLNGLQASAPHLYPPEAPSSGVKPPSTTSSDIQAEVRRQVREFMVLRDEENRELRTRVDLLMSENRTLRQEISSQLYSSDPSTRPVGPGRFSGLEWIGRGFGNLMSGISSPKPGSPPKGLVDLRPPPPPPAAARSVGASQSPPGLPASGLVSDEPQDLGFRVSFNPRGIEPLRESVPAQAPPINAQVPTARTLDFGPAELGEPRLEASNPGITENATADPMNVVLTGMAQLQGVVADLANSPKQARQEVIKPGVNTLPELPAVGAESCLQFADWLHVSSHRDNDHRGLSGRSQG